MKSILGFILFVAAVAVTGGLYLTIREGEKKHTDMERLSSICAPVVHHLQQLGDYLVKTYNLTVARFIPGADRERVSFPNQQSSIIG